MRIYEIIPGQLYQSARTHKLTLEQKLQMVSQYQLSAVVNLWHTADVDMQRITFRYIHCSIPDGRRIDEAAIGAVVDKVVEDLGRGFRFLVHCYGGRNRSGLINALVVRRVLKVSGPEALALVRARRPRALANDTFAQYLARLDLPA